jgi:hypothetical protein
MKNKALGQHLVFSPVDVFEEDNYAKEAIEALFL